MFESNAMQYLQESLVAKLLQIRAASESQDELLKNVNDWFVTERITKSQKHLVFTGVYHRHDQYGDLFSMGEMMDMWHLCQMQDYVDPKPNLIASTRSLFQSALALVPAAADRCDLSFC